MRGSKEDRFREIGRCFAEGRVCLPEFGGQVDWVADFVDKVKLFPIGDYDDDVIRFQVRTEVKMVLLPRKTGVQP